MFLQNKMKIKEKEETGRSSRERKTKENIFRTATDHNRKKFDTTN